MDILMKPLRRNLFVFSLILLLGVFSATPAQARVSLIRDAEIEQTLRLYSDPVFKQAGLAPQSIRIFIVNDPSINAFVAGGQNMFIHTGLLQTADTPEMLIGVIAHETGHIAGGHLAQGAEKLRNAQLGTLLSYILGAAAAVGGAGDVGPAIMTAGQQVAQRNLMSFSRMNEQAADQAALSYMDALGYSVEGLLSLMEKLRTKENLYAGQIDPYALTHPLSRDRIAHIRGHLLQQEGKTQPISADFKTRMERMRAKLEGFINNPQSVLNRYPATDTSLTARYARAVAYHRLSQLKPALVEIDALIATAPEDPFFNELKGQILFESGQLAEALPYYEKAVQLLPDSALLKTDLGRTLLAQTPPRHEEALRQLKQSSVMDNTNIMTWKLLGSAYGARGEKGEAALAYAEASLLENEPEEALRQVTQALDALSPDSPSRLRAQDLQTEAMRQKREMEDAGRDFG
jgi:predicted Zn-dependent protease